jgi:hypothetical protein
MKILSATCFQQVAVPGAGRSSGDSPGCSCGLSFTSADLNIAITTPKHLPLLDISCAGRECGGAASKTKINYLYR